MNRPAEALLVGIDVGTTMTKAVVVGLDGTELSWGRSRTLWRAAPSGNEAYPEDFLAAVVGATSSALSSAPAGQVVGIGVTSMAETVVRLGADGRPVGPAVAWHDPRGAAEAVDLAAEFGATGFSARTGLDASPLCTLVKLAWLHRNGLPVGRRALSVADWVVHCLGGEQVAEASLASRTGALTLEGRRWWQEGLQWAGAPHDLFPTVGQAGDLSGRVTPEALAALPTTSAHQGPLSRLIGAALTSAGHDHLSAAAGAGAVDQAQVLCSCGTAEAFARAIPPLDGPELAEAVSAGLSSGWHTVPGKYSLLVGHALGLLLEPVLRLLGTEGVDAITALDAAAQVVPPNTLRVLRDGPFSNPSIVGTSSEASPAALWDAALALVTADARKEISVVERIGGPAGELVLSGGWAHLAGFRQRRLGLLPRLRWPAVNEAGARGAALFGGCAAGVFAGPAAFPVPVDRGADGAGPLAGPVQGTAVPLHN